MAWAPMVGGTAQPSYTTSEFLSCRLNCDLSHVNLSSLTACLLAPFPTEVRALQPAAVSPAAFLLPSPRLVAAEGLPLHILPA